MRRALITLLTALMLTLMAVSPTAAQGAVAVIDQSNSDFTPPLLQNVRQFNSIGQEFIPGLAGLDAVELWIADFGNPGANPPPPDYPIQLRVNIRKATINGEIVGTSDAAAISQGFSGPVTFTFLSLVKLRPADVYVMEVVSVSGPEAAVGSSGGPNSTYPFGDQILLGARQSNNDLWFQEGFANQTPLSSDYCKNQLWQHLNRANGGAFKNQGDCILFVNTGN